MKRSETLYMVMLNGAELDAVLDALETAAKADDYRREIITAIGQLRSPQQMGPTGPGRYYPERGIYTP